MTFQYQSALLSLSLACAVTATASTSNSSWRGSVDSLIAQGEFTRAERVMQRLPKQVRRQQAVAIDSLRQVMERTRLDFSLSPQEGTKLILQQEPNTTAEQIEQWKKSHALEVMNIDGGEWWFRKSVRNLWLLGEEFKERNRVEAHNEAQSLLQHYREVMHTAPDAQGRRNWHRVNITFTLDIAPNVIPHGETYRVWLPFPFENGRQRNMQLESSNYPITMSEGSKHHTVYMEAQAQRDKPTHFEYTFGYDVAEYHMAQQDLLALVQPYKPTALYEQYTASQPPHIVVTDDMKRLAQEIAGHDENPVTAASRIYHWIAGRFPWAGAREYSTLSCIPNYVLTQGHGDCGQVALLYITLCRAYGIPARWESGYMLHPGEVNFHDWAETYFEGVGWVPTDVSFGRSTEGTALHDYYATGIDLYRLATNEATGAPLSPGKQHLRSETVDFQAGEVEWKKGNIYSNHWKSNIHINSITKIDNQQ